MQFSLPTIFLALLSATPLASAGLAAAMPLDAANLAAREASPDASPEPASTSIRAREDNAAIFARSVLKRGLGPTCSKEKYQSQQRCPGLCQWGANGSQKCARGDELLTRDLETRGEDHVAVFVREVVARGLGPTCSKSKYQSQQRCPGLCQWGLNGKAGCT